MPRTQFLSAASLLNTQKDMRITQARTSSAPQTGSMISSQLLLDIQKMSLQEKFALKKLYGKQMAQERRFCNSGSCDYDFNRHLRLYLIEKHLAKMQTAPGGAV